MGDLDKMDVNQLIAAYCSLRYDNVCYQATIAEKIVYNPVLLKQINTSAKLMVDFIRAYASRRSTITRVIAYKKDFREEATRHADVISKLNVVPLIGQMSLADVVHILRSFFVGRIEGIHHFLLGIYSRLITEYAQLDYRQAF